MCGLKESDVVYIINQVKNIDKIERLAIFGSRARGNHRQNSDIDIVVYGGGIDKALIYRLYEVLEENAPYPYFVDIVSYDMADDVLKKEIDLNSVILYVK